MRSLLCPPTLLLATLLGLAGCSGMEGVGVPGGLNARRVELAQPVVMERTLHHDIAYQGNEILPSSAQQVALREFLMAVEANPDDFLAVAVEPAATAQLTLERERQLVGLLRGWGFRAAGTAGGTAGGFGQNALVLVQQLRLLQPAGCIADSAQAVIAQANEVAMHRIGCSTAHNLGLMVKDPRDLVAAQPMSGADGERAAFLYQKFRTRDPALDRQRQNGGFTPQGQAGGS